MNEDDQEQNVRDACTAQYIADAPDDIAQFAKNTIEGFFQCLQMPFYTACREDIYSYADHIGAADLPDGEWMKIVEVLGGFFAFAARNGYVARNPMTEPGKGIPRFLAKAQDTHEYVLSSRGMMRPVLAPQISPAYTSSADTLEGVYFPFARCFNETFLKASVLAYDRLWFLDPLDRETRSLISTFRSDGLVYLPDWARWVDTYDQLSEAGAISIVNDFSLYRQFDNLLAAALIADCRDRAFVTTAMDAMNNAGWSIHRSRLPSSSEMADLDLQGRWGLSLPDTRRNEWYQSPMHRDPNLDTGAGYQDFSSSYIMYVGHDLVHPVIGFSATVNQTMLTCSLRNIVPVSDSATAVALLSHKYLQAKHAQQVSVERNDIKHDSISHKRGHVAQDMSHINKLPEYDAGIAQLAFSTITSLISADELSRRSFGDLIEYRAATLDKMRAFRRLIVEIRSTIEETPWTPTFDEAIRRTIDGRIRPAYAQLQGDLQSTYEKMFGNMIVGAAKTLTPSAVLSVFPGLSLAEILAWGSTIGAGLAATSVKPLVDTWTTRRALKRNGLAWLMELSK
jgi:hypothetical protein